MDVTPKDAATIIFLRQSSNSYKGNFEVLMVLRHRKSKFVPGSYVFPGGCLEQEDYWPEMEILCSGVDLKKAQAIIPDMSSPEKSLGVWVAGIHQEMISFNSEAALRQFHSYRKKLQTREITLKAILLNEGLTLAVDRLHYFSHWITPEFLPLRYDVRFFVAEAPAHQEAIHDGIELTNHVWLTPQKILDGYARHQFDMVVPTLVTIEELSRYITIQEVIASTKKKEINSILTVMVEEDDGIVEYMPDGKFFKNMPPSVV
jgi:hypothetical protein